MDDVVVDPLAFRPITLTPTSLVLAVGDEQAITATGGPVKAWATSDPTVAALSGAGGTVRGQGAGRATITAKGGPHVATAAVTVTAPDRPIIEPPIEPPSAGLVPPGAVVLT